MTVARPMLRTTYRSDIDGMRGVAVLAVLLYHAYPTSIRGGFTGVDVFFVISGYLISNVIVANLDAGRFSLADFYARRVRRILPALLVVIPACFAVGWFVLRSDEYKQLCSHIAAGAGFASNIVLWAESGYFDQSAETKPLLHLWSLGIEEQFYLVWPILLAVAWRLRISLLKLSIVLAALSFACNVLTVAGQPASAFFLPHTRAWELMIGSTLAQAKPSGQAHANSRSVVGAGLIAVGLFVVDRSKAFPGAWALLPTVGTALVISAGPGAWLNKNVLASRPMVGLGLISYPLYLWHWPLLSFGRIIQSEELGALTRLGMLVAATALASCTYAFVERPVRKMRRGVLVVSLVAALFAFGAIGHYGFVRDGWPDRAAVVHYKYNRDQLVRMPSTDDECKRYVGGEPLFPYCRYSNVHGAATIALIGDSHAHVAYPGVAAMLRDHGISTLMMAHSACPFDAACGPATHQMLSALSADRTIDRVFIFCRGPRYLVGSSMMDLGKGLNASPRMSPETLQGALQSTIDALRTAGKHVYVVSDPPELLVAPIACLPRPLRTTKNKCEVDVDTVKRFQLGYAEVLRGLHDAKVIPTMEAFCPGGTCRAVRADELLYADDNHLSVAGSQFLASEVLRAELLQ